MALMSLDAAVDEVHKIGGGMMSKLARVVLPKSQWTAGGYEEFLAKEKK